MDKDAAAHWNRGFMTAIIIAIVVLIILMYCKKNGISGFTQLIPSVDRMSIPRVGREYMNIPNTRW
jgi:hypothetical protein